MLVTYRELPNLQLLLCRNDQNQLATKSSPPLVSGYTDHGCRCLVCKASTLSKFVYPPPMPGYCVKIPQWTSCQSGPALIYHLVCTSSRSECEVAHYVGRASSSNSKVKATSASWANHKSHAKQGHDFCAMTAHFVKIQILQSAPNIGVAKTLEKF